LSELAKVGQMNLLRDVFGQELVSSFTNMHS